MVYCICNLLCRAPYHRIGISSPVPFLVAIANCEKVTATIAMSAGPFVLWKLFFPTGRIFTKFGN